MLVGKKTCRSKKKCRLENFPWQKRTYPECPEFPVMQHRRTAEAGGKPPRAYREENKMLRSFFVSWSNKKKCWSEKKMPAVQIDRA